MKRLDDYLSILKGKASDASSIPSKIAGLNKDSCTATAAGIHFWLTGELKELSELEPASGSFGSKLAGLDKLEFPPAQDSLLVFHTPNHKFCVLMVGAEAVLLQSNQWTADKNEANADDAPSYDFATYLARGVKRMDKEELGGFFNDLQRALVDENEDHRDIFGKWFNVRQKRGNRDAYWFALVTCSAT